MAISSTGSSAGAIGVFDAENEVIIALISGGIFLRNYFTFLVDTSVRTSTMRRPGELDED